MKRILTLLIALALFFVMPLQPAAATSVLEHTPFSTVWLSDTQNRVYYNFQNALTSMGKWIAENRCTAYIEDEPTKKGAITDV